MGYKIKKVSFENFKYIKAEDRMELIIDDASLILLNGPNGYGKTTIFDAIELLLTGDIKSFKSDLLNKGNISKNILANDSNKDIIINGELINEAGNSLVINRVFSCSKKFESIIKINDKIINQKYLETLLRFNKNMFDIGMYISQKEYLEFLEKKYGDRKSTISGILDDSEISKNKEFLKGFEVKLKEKILVELKEDKDKIDVILQEKRRLEEQNSKIINISKEIKYVRLFIEKEYGFDKEELDYSLMYEKQIETLEEIKTLIREYEQFQNTKKIIEIEKVLKLDKLEIKALYYREIIKQIKSNIDIFRRIKNIDELVEKKEYESCKVLGELAGISSEKIKEINNIIEKYKLSIKKLSENEKIKKELLEKRSKLWEAYNKNVSNNQWNNNKCPLCGKDASDLEKLYNQTKIIIEENSSLLMSNINLLNEQINSYFEEIRVINEKWRNKYKEQYLLYIELEDCINIDITKFDKEIELLNVNKFICNGDLCNRKYEQEKLELLNNLNSTIKQLGIKLTQIKITRFNNIIKEYYSNGIMHTIEDIDDKISYIAFKYSNGYSEKISLLIKELTDKNEEYNKKEMKFKSSEKGIIDFRKKYESAYKEYQTKLIRKIRIPLYIYSGKVIQNYPMGLGINIGIKENQIIFQTDIKEDDIFNYLSMGQLNGVVLSIMLAVRSTLNFSNGIDLIMIDDPLQSIDDISAFSFADLLAEFNSNSQIILSTHEEDKSNLFEFKFKQHSKKVKIFNMHNKYIKDKLD